MRNLFAVSALALVSLAACGGGSTKADMTVVADLSAPDLTVVGTVTCANTLLCAAGCTSIACETTCKSMATPAAQGLFSALFACAYTPCLTGEDGGTAACSSMTDVSAGCQSCVTTAATSATCSSELNACEAS